MYLGIDIGGTKVAMRADTDSAVVAESVFTWRPDDTADDDIRRLRDHVEDLRDRIDRIDRIDPLAGVGVAMPATLDPDGRVIAWPNRPTWLGLDLKAVLDKLFPAVTAFWADDGDLAAAAEAHTMGLTDVVYAGVGTGIGGGIVLNGRSVGGRRGSCELGHLIVDLAGEVCDCGRRGCVQAIASGPAILRRATRLRRTEVTFAALADGFADRADWAVEAIRPASTALATALTGVGELVRPSAIVIGGGFATGIPGFVDHVASAAAALSRPGHPVAPVLSARLGSDSSLHGAVLAARGLV